MHQVSPNVKAQASLRGGAAARSTAGSRQRSRWVLRFDRMLAGISIMPWPLAITHPCEYQEGKSDTTLSMRWNVRNKMKRAIVEGCEEPVSRHLEHGILQASNLSARETCDTRLELN